MRFLYADSFLLGVNNEDRIRDSGHVLDSAEVLLKLLPFLLDLDNFLLGKHIEGSILSHGLDLFQSVDSASDGLEVGEHAAQPSLIYIIHTAALCLGLHRILCLLLGSNEQDRSALSGDLGNRIVSLIDLSYRLLQVDDVDAVSLGEDVGSHLGVPSSRLMSEMNTCFQ